MVNTLDVVVGAEYGRDVGAVGDDSMMSAVRLGPPDPLGGVAIVVLTYEAAATVRDVLQRIPPEVARSVGAIVVSDDDSSDASVWEATRWAREQFDVNTKVVRQPHNLGYGGNQRWCYQWAADQGFEHVIMIHGDGQYAPELATQLLAPLLSGDADAVFGSRMIDPHGARRGGMPLYKRLGNRVLTTVQNRATGLRLSEWHCGYRAYSTKVLAELDLEHLSGDFDFDTQIILALHRRHARIREIAIPTFYGDEKCHVNGLRYASKVIREVLRYRRHASPQQ